MRGLLSIAIAFCGVFVYLKLRVGALDAQPLALYAIESVAALTGLWAILSARSSRRPWLNRVAGVIGILLVFGCYLGLGPASDYGDERPRGPAIGTAFPAMNLVDAVTGASLDLRGRPHFVVLFRGFW